jgi:hypothetical protein
MNACECDAVQAMQLIRQSMLASGQHVKFTTDPKKIPNDDLEMKLYRSLLNPKLRRYVAIRNAREEARKS